MNRGVLVLALCAAVAGCGSSATSNGGGNGGGNTLSSVTGIAAGFESSCAVVTGGVKCWGDNTVGELGIDPATSSTSVPVQVQGLASGVQAIAGGRAHSCALVNGGVQCWGENDSGQLGIDPATPTTSVPVDVEGVTSGVTAIAAGDRHSCAVVNGGVRCWGGNYFGQLGNSITSSNVPVDVEGLTSGVSAIAAGNYFSCAVVNGGAKCWGANDSGQLGIDPATPSTSVPVQVQGLTSGVTAITAGVRHSCAVVDGGVKCWGRNDSGLLGIDPATAYTSVPVQVQGLTGGVTAVSTGAWHTCAVSSGGAMCWGDNSSGQLGIGLTTNYSSVPVQVQGLTSDVTAIAAGGYHTCAVVKGGVQCWGRNELGQLGNNSTKNSLVPVQVQ